MKKYCVAYRVTTEYDTVVEARNTQEAEAKVIEVIGEHVTILVTYEQKEKKDD